MFKKFRKTAKILLLLKLEIETFDIDAIWEFFNDRVLHWKNDKRLKPRKIHSKKVPQRKEATKKQSLTRSKPSTKQNEHLQLMAEKKRKTIQLMAEKTNDYWTTTKHYLLLMAEKKILKNKPNCDILTYLSAEEWMLQPKFRYTQKTGLSYVCFMMLIILQTLKSE